MKRGILARPSSWPSVAAGGRLRLRRHPAGGGGTGSSSSAGTPRWRRGDLSAAIESVQRRDRPADRLDVGVPEARRGLPPARRARRRRSRDLRPARAELGSARRPPARAARRRQLLAASRFAPRRRALSGLRRPRRRSPRVLYKLGLAHYRAGQPGPAIDRAREGDRARRTFAEAHYLLGLCLRDAQKPSEALRALRARDRAGAGHARRRARSWPTSTARSDGRTTGSRSSRRCAPSIPAPAREVALGLAYARAGQSIARS